MANKTTVQTVRRGYVFAPQKNLKLDFELKKDTDKFILEITTNGFKPGVVIEEQQRTIKSNVTEWRPKLEVPVSELSPSELKVYEKQIKDFNTALKNGTTKVIDNKINKIEVTPVVIEKNITQIIPVEKEVNTWVEIGKKKFELYVDLSAKALRLFVKNYSKTL